MRLQVLWLAVWVLGIAALAPTKTVHYSQRDTSNPQFVTSKGGRFSLNGSDFRFVGTNAYWLQALNSEEDLITTFRNMTAKGITVVRTWAFNDVDVIPTDNSTWFQFISNGTLTLNNGTNGLQKLDAVIRQAENFGIHLMLTLTNNWNPRPLFDNLTASIDNLTATVEGSANIGRRDVTPGTNNSLPRNTLSNDYGGMDVYVRQFGLSNHDAFYTNESIIAAFENYTTNIVSRYVNSPAILAWEVANDPRCNSSVAASASCNTTTVTSWVARVAQHISTVDKNHLITSGNQGFLCQNCTKLFPLVSPPHVSSVAVAGKRNVAPRLTLAKVLQDRKERTKKRAVAARAAQPSTGRTIRGRWKAPITKRQDINGVGSAFDGSQGVDSEDLINIPQIGFGTFQLFPDQNSYGPTDPNLDPFNNTVENGIDWIKSQAAVSQLFGKPVTLTGFGLVTQENAPFWVPFNTSIAPFGFDQGNTSVTVAPYGVNDTQRDSAYTSWLQAGIASGLQGMLQYQWGQNNLTAVNGSTFGPDTTSTAMGSNQNATALSPNDGYSIQGIGEETAQNVIQQASQAIGSA